MYTYVLAGVESTCMLQVALYVRKCSVWLLRQGGIVWLPLVMSACVLLSDSTQCSILRGVKAVVQVGADNQEEQRSELECTPSPHTQ